MRHLLMKSCVAIFLLCYLLTASAQSTINGDAIKSQLIKEWERSKIYTIEYLNTMPANKYDFKAVDSIRSFAQQMLHLSAANVLFLSAATGESRPFATLPDRNIETSASAQSKDSVTYFVTASYDYAINSIKKMDASKLLEDGKIFGMTLSKYAMILKALEHQAHHRGQTTIYIRLLGIRPPNERLF